MYIAVSCFSFVSVTLVIFLLGHSIYIQRFKGTAFFMFVTHFIERIVIKMEKLKKKKKFTLFTVAYIYQHAICGYAGHVTARLSTRIGTAGQESIWTNRSSDLQSLDCCRAQLNYFLKDV